MSSQNQGKMYSFWQLLIEQKIEIPIIQRDYAQGREDKKEIRMEFLGALLNSLRIGKPIKLDFIYGCKINDTFQPLDGQQRLTTLFLLHWYAASKEGMLNDEITRILTKFSYETRASSREFCNELVSHSISFDNTTETVSEILTNSSWYFLSWKKDPTIDSMLRAIDDIHQLFKDIEELWAKLISEEKLISFYYVQLENFGLTDDLYIKMNARGKLLTPYENYKALFQKHIADSCWDREKKFQETFACKIDTIWTDLFWQHRKSEKIDSSIIRFISTIAMIRLVLEKFEDRADKLAKLQKRPDDVRVEYFTNRGYLYLTECLDIYCRVYKNDLPIKLDMPFWQHAPEENIFTALVYEGSVTASYTQKVLFFAQTEYLRRVPQFDEVKFQSWMRVIRNIISRGDAEKTGRRPTIIRSPDTFIGVINLINELSGGCDNIYEYLSTRTIKSAFAKEQIEEEILKAKLIAINDINREVIFSTEDTNFCQGKIQFALNCIDYHTESDQFKVNHLKKIQIVLKTYFEEEKVTDDLRRALLTVSIDGDYKYYDYWRSWSYAVDSNKRCLIDKYRELEYYIYGTKNSEIYMSYLKKLFLQLTEKDLKSIISEFKPPCGMPNWKVRLIKEEKLLNEQCKSKYIAIPDDESCCYLLRVKRARDKDSCIMID